ncbi:MAG: glutamate-cysteine ligase family protein, partial [Polyangiaceae bacterium]|nr:glutamate-cysteine ligase family protein [Polyangiaceae bacterium]
MSHCNCPFDDNVDLVSLDRDRLSLLFASSCKPISAFKIGIEHERFGVNKRNFDPVQYEGHDGVTGLFQEFVDRYGWEAQSEVPGGPVISLRRGTAAITLEPAAQFEFSGSPCIDLHTLEHERTIHANELRTISNEKGIMWQASGFHPFAKHEQLSWVPKLRYGIMREYLATQGTDALEMMCRTATVQANFDYCSIEDGLRKLRVALKISPIVSAMFANGPIVEGKPYGGKSRRIQTWLSVDPARQGILPQMWSENASLDAYIDWGLDAPMFLFMRDGKAVKNTGQSFRSFILDGFGGYRAKLSDWTSHINTLFPEVRLKETIETRGADSVPDRYATALP